MEIVSAVDLKKYYGAEPTLTKALDGVSLEIEQGEFAAIVGSSGSGKTTLLNMLGALDRPDSGTVTIDGSELTQMSEEERTVFRRQKIGFVFQNYNLVPILSVYGEHRPDKTPAFLPASLGGPDPCACHLRDLPRRKRRHLCAFVQNDLKDDPLCFVCLSRSPDSFYHSRPACRLPVDSGGHVLLFFA